MMVYEWAVIGAGPAGIASVGKLLDFGISKKDIVWIDPAFAVGDLGSLWRNVPSNTKVKLFLKFLNASPAFHYSNSANHFEINRADPEKTCYLELIAEPLQAVTDYLKKTVHAVQGFAENLFMSKRLWNIALKKGTIQTKNVILAIGAEPTYMNYPSLSTIPLHIAMDSKLIQGHINRDDTIAVFGSSHSAILVLRNLVENKVKQILNFYRTPLRYAVYLNDWILFDDTGLKGPTADWAREYLDGNLPHHLMRIYSNNENIEHHLPTCNKIIYAIGFERRLKPIIQDIGHFEYVKQCGIIAPGLFGIGIAFPEAKYNPIGLLEYRVGLWKFMEYLHYIMPMWLKYST